MDYDELLKGIGDLIDRKLDEKLDQKFAPIVSDIATIQEDISAIKVDVEAIKVDVEAIKVDVEAVKVDVEAVKVDVEAIKVDVEAVKVDVATNGKNITLLATRMGKLEKNYRRLGILLEHDIPKSISLLVEGHGDILERIVDKREIDDIKDRVSTTETVIMMHTKEIELLKKTH